MTIRKVLSDAKKTLPIPRFRVTDRKSCDRCPAKKKTMDIKFSFYTFFQTLFKPTLLVASLLIWVACDNDSPQDELPPAAFSPIVLDLNLPSNQALSRDGGFIRLSQGLRGMIVYRENAASYHAIDQNCTYLPFEASSTVDIDPNNPTLLQDPSCGSIFLLPDVFPSGGPAILPLRKYNVSLAGRTLTITDEAIQ